MSAVTAKHCDSNPYPVKAESEKSLPLPFCGSAWWNDPETASLVDKMQARGEEHLALTCRAVVRQIPSLVTLQHSLARYWAVDTGCLKESGVLKWTPNSRALTTRMPTKRTPQLTEEAMSVGTSSRWASRWKRPLMRCRSSEGRSMRFSCAELTGWLFHGIQKYPLPYHPHPT